MADKPLRLLLTQKEVQPESIPRNKLFFRLPQGQF